MALRAQGVALQQKSLKYRRAVQRIDAMMGDKPDASDAAPGASSSVGPDAAERPMSSGRERLTRPSGQRRIEHEGACARHRDLACGLAHAR